VVYVVVHDDREKNQIVAASSDEVVMQWVPDFVPYFVTKTAMEGKPETRLSEAPLLRDVKSSDGRLRGRKGDAIFEVDQDLFTQSGDRVGVLRIGMSGKRAEEEAKRAAITATTAGAIAVFLAMLFAVLLARSLTRPIEALAETMKRVGEGDLGQEAKVEGRDEVARLAWTFNAMLSGLRQKKALEKYVPMGARKDLEKDTSGHITMGGARVRATILFSDLRGFTSLSEKLPPDEVVGMLNEYLDAMAKVIVAGEGDINEYIGDAILAVFPCKDGRNGSLLAARAAWEMREELARLQLRTKNPHLRELRMGIGLHTGELVEGNIGSEDRVKFGVVGDTVNTAARIQDKSRDGKHTHIFLSDVAKEELEGEFDVECVGDLQFKGKSEPMKTWEIVEPTTRAHIGPSLWPKTE
jgi:adenylate cyclase